MCHRLKVKLNSGPTLTGGLQAQPQQKLQKERSSCLLVGGVDIAVQRGGGHGAAAARWVF